MAERYSLLMDILYRISMWIAGIALLIMVAIIPLGIFARYVMNSALSWPEPIAIICMVTFTFVGAAVSYRAGSHIAVSMVTDRLSKRARKICFVVADLMLMAISLFIFWYSSALCAELWEQPVAEFPFLPPVKLICRCRSAQQSRCCLFSKRCCVARNITDRW